MSATGLATNIAKNALATAYARLGQYVSVLQALVLQSATPVGATTFQVQLAVQAGDVIVLDQGLTTQEQVTVQSVSGASSPYTVTPATPLTQAHASGAKCAHVPLNSTSLHEVSVTRVASNFGNPTPAGVSTSSASAITVPSGNIVGSLALFSAAATTSSSGLTSATDTITETATALANDDVIVFTAVGAAALQLETPYWVVSKSTNSFKVAATKGGAALTLGTASGIAYTKGFYLDATPVKAQDYTASGGTYTPNWVETQT